MHIHLHKTQKQNFLANFRVNYLNVLLDVNTNHPTEFQRYLLHDHEFRSIPLLITIEQNHPTKYQITSSTTVSESVYLNNSHRSLSELSKYDLGNRSHNPEFPLRTSYPLFRWSSNSLQHLRCQKPLSERQPCNFSNFTAQFPQLKCLRIMIYALILLRTSFSQ